MNKRIDFSKTGGYPLSQNDLAFMQESYRDVMASLAPFIGDKVIYAGMVEAGGDVTAGWIAIGNELIPFAAGTIGTGEFILEETNSALVFKDGNSKTVKYTRIAKFSAGGPYQYADLVRVNAKEIKQALDALITAYNAHTHAWADITGKPPGYISHVGNYAFGDVVSDTKKTVVIPDQGVNTYVVVGNLRGTSGNWNDDNDVMFIIYNKQNASFDIAIREVTSTTQNLVFDYVIIK